MTEMIGRGERASLQILKKMFGSNAKFFIQYPLKKILTPEYLESLSDRQLKETVDIFIVDGSDKIVVRVQDERHMHTYLSKMDKNQRKLLEWSGVRVVDINEMSCPTLFKDIVNEESKKEFMSEFLG